MIDNQQLLSEMNMLGPWFQTIQVRDGLYTPGEEGEATLHKFSYIEQHLVGPITGSSVLDLGCNAGALSLEFAKRGAIVTGIDMNELYIKQARWLAAVTGYNIRYEKMWLNEISQLGQFDIIVFFGLLYHIRTPFESFQLIRAACKRQLLIESGLAAQREEAVIEWDPATNCLFPSPSMVELMLKETAFTNVHLVHLASRRFGARGYFVAQPA